MGWMAPVPGVVMRHNAVPLETTDHRSHPNEYSTIGLDLTKNIFQACGGTADGEIAFNRPIRRAGLFKFFKKQPPCLVSMVACVNRSSAQSSSMIISAARSTKIRSAGASDGYRLRTRREAYLCFSGRYGSLAGWKYQLGFRK